MRAESFEARVFAQGAAITLERPPWRQRLYLHLDAGGEGAVTAIWLYAAGLASTGGADGIPAEALRRAGKGAELVSLVGGGNSGAALARIRADDGTLRIAKELRPGGDWLGRALGGGVRSAELWRSGVLRRLPDGLDPAILDAFEAGGSWWLVMPDVSAHLLGDERRLTRDESGRVLALAAAMHARFRGERIPALATLEARLGAASAGLAQVEAAGHDLLPKQFPAAWDAFRAVAGEPLASAIPRLADEPRPLAERLAARGTTLTHGDLRDDNLGLAPDRVILLDWDMASAATPAVEFAWYLCHDAWRIDASHDEIVADFREAAGSAVSDADLDLGLVAGLVMYGWVFGHSAVVHPDPAEREWAREELEWWLPRAAEALERSGLGSS